jgi:uncharacterized membrane protein YfcA
VTPDPSWQVLLLLALAAVSAGFVDAVVGGGGLVQLPALLLGLPSATPAQILATNKLGSICGTSVSSVTYYRRVQPDPRTFVPLMLLAYAGSVAGAVVASRIPRSAFEPIVLVALVLVGAWVVLRPALGRESALRFSGHRHTAAAMGTGLAVGFYDGVLGYSFLDASAKAKLANWATNLGALCVFVPQGAVLWKVGLVLGLSNLVGGYLGARVAISRGSGFVRGFFIVVVTAFVVRIGGDVAGLWG